MQATRHLQSSKKTERRQYVVQVALKNISEPPYRGPPPQRRPCLPTKASGIFWNSASVSGALVNGASRYW